MRRAWILILVAAGLCCVAPARSVDACHNGVVYELDGDVRQVMTAERLLSGGRPDRALRTAHLAAERMRRNAPAAGRQVIRRAQQVMATAVVRLEGRVDLTRRVAAPRTADGQRVTNLRWARDLLGALRRGDDQPVLHARHAEALAHFTETRAEALATLRDLARRDLMPDAYGYRALARLEQLAGEPQASTRALSACEALAGSLRRQVCTLPG